VQEVCKEVQGGVHQEVHLGVQDEVHKEVWKRRVQIIAKISDNNASK
jgi:hypothetical protein